MSPQKFKETFIKGMKLAEKNYVKILNTEHFMTENGSDSRSTIATYHLSKWKSLKNTHTNKVTKPGLEDYLKKSIANKKGTGFSIVYHPKADEKLFEKTNIEFLKAKKDKETLADTPQKTAD